MVEEMSLEERKRKKKEDDGGRDKVRRAEKEKELQGPKQVFGRDFLRNYWRENCLAKTGWREQVAESLSHSRMRSGARQTVKLLRMVCGNILIFVLYKAVRTIMK